MCFKFINGNTTHIFLETMRFCLFVFLKETLGVGHGFLEVENPEFSGSLSHKCSSSREARGDSWDLVLQERMACSPACHWTTHAPCQEILLIQNNWLLAKGIVLLDCGPLTTGPSCAVQTSWKPNKLQI